MITKLGFTLMLLALLLTALLFTYLLCFRSILWGYFNWRSGHGRRLFDRKDYSKLRGK